MFSLVHRKYFIFMDFIVDEKINYHVHIFSIRQLFDTANLSYILPSHRLTVYIIGIYLGYLLRRYPKGLKINKVLPSALDVDESILYICIYKVFHNSCKVIYLEFDSQSLDSAGW